MVTGALQGISEDFQWIFCEFQWTLSKFQRGFRGLGVSENHRGPLDFQRVSGALDVHRASFRGISRS